jgi:hypothetical protein
MPLLCVGLCLKNQNIKCTLICSQRCLVLLSAYLGAMRRGLGFEASFKSMFVVEKSKCYIHISLLSAISCFVKCICRS